MNITDTINYLAVIVLIGFVVALIYLIALLHRANRIVGRLEHLSTTFRSFVSDIVPAIVNIGTIATAMESVLRSLHTKAGHGHDDPKDSKKKGK